MELAKSAAKLELVRTSDKHEYMTGVSVVEKFSQKTHDSSIVLKKHMHDWDGLQNEVELTDTVSIWFMQNKLLFENRGIYVARFV